MSTAATFLVLAGFGYALLYLLAIVIFPFRACRHCHGRGTRHNPLSLGGFRQCTHCAGTGRSVRPGRRLLAALNTDPGGRWRKITGDPRPATGRRRR